jgi:hypothetical protein
LNIEDLYTIEDIMPDYLDVGKIPEVGDEPGVRKISGKLPIGVDQGVSAQICRTPVVAPRCNENLHKILGPKGKIQHLPNMFLAMAQDASAQELPTATLAIGLYDDNTAGILPGQYVCELHLVIHRMPDDKDMRKHVDVKRKPDEETPPSVPVSGE